MPGYKNSTRRKSSRRGSDSSKSNNQGPSNPPPTRNYNAISEDYRRCNFDEKFEKIVTNEAALGASSGAFQEKLVLKQRLGEKHGETIVINEPTAGASSGVFQEKLVYKTRNEQVEGYDRKTSYYDEANWVNRRRSFHHTGNVTSLSQGFSHLSVRSTHTLRAKSSERSSSRNYDSVFEKLAIKPRFGDKHDEKSVTYEATAGASSRVFHEKLVLKPRNGQDGIGALYEGSDGKFKYYDGENWVYVQ